MEEDYYDGWDDAEGLYKRPSRQETPAGKNYKGKKKKNKNGKRKKWPIVVAVVLVVLLLTAAGVYAAINHYYNKSNYVPDKEIEVQSEVETDSTGITEQEAEILQTEIIEQTQDIVAPDNTESKVYNLLLIGLDRRDRSWYGNSDSMILLSINHATKQIRMTSFMRDLYADIPGIGVKKLNAACAYGSGPLLVQTIEQNYKISIDNYASVDFYSMIDIIDLLGGIEIDITDAEIRVANMYIEELCAAEGVSASANYIKNSGLQTMNGYQAVAYTRIRYVGNADYQRTERQRIVLGKIMSKCAKLGVTDLNALADTILPLVTHNVEQSTLLGLLSQLPSILSYDIVQSRVPYDGMFSTRGEILVPDFGATIERLQKEIYGDSGAEQ